MKKWYLYGKKKEKDFKRVASFDSEQQLLAYTRWATLKNQDGIYKFEQKTPLTGCVDYKYKLEENIDFDIPHNPTPGML